MIQGNLLQKNKTATAAREFRELKKCLEKLTQQQLECLIEIDAADERLLFFPGGGKLYGFIDDFIVEVLKRKVLTFDPILMESDYSWFYQTKAEVHPELEAIMV